MENSIMKTTTVFHGSWRKGKACQSAGKFESIAEESENEEQEQRSGRTARSSGQGEDLGGRSERRRR